MKFLSSVVCKLMCSAAQAQKFLSASFFRPWVSPKSSSRLRRGAHPCTSQFAVRSSDRPRCKPPFAVQSSDRLCVAVPGIFFFGAPGIRVPKWLPSIGQYSVFCYKIILKGEMSGYNLSFLNNILANGLFSMKPTIWLFCFLKFDNCLILHLE